MLAVYLLFLFATATTTVTSNSTADGGNGDARHCNGQNDYGALFRDKLPPPMQIKALLKTYVDEQQGAFYITIEVPYLAFDVRYVIGTSPFEASSNGTCDGLQKAATSRCFMNYDRAVVSQLKKIKEQRTYKQNLANNDAYMSEWDVSEGKSADTLNSRTANSYLQHLFGVANASSSGSSDARIWRHAPNAKYGKAFSSRDEYPAYYVDSHDQRGSKWTASHKGCSAIQYVGRYTLGELRECWKDTEDSALVSFAEDNVRTLAGMFHIDVVRASNPCVSYAHQMFAFSVTVDESNNKVVITENALTMIEEEERSKVTTRLRQLYTKDKDGDRLHVTIQMAQTIPSLARHHANKTHASLAMREKVFKLTSISNIDPDSSFAIDQDTSEAVEQPYYWDDEPVVLSNFHLVSRQYADTYDGRFSLEFENHVTKKKHIAHLTVLIANQRSIDFASTELHSEITQHEEHHKTTEQHEGEYEDGNRICMQTYIIGPERFAKVLQAELIEAWLCGEDVDLDVASHDGELLCPTRRHRVLLYNKTMNNPLYNVTIHSPGAYGSTSVAVCFNAKIRMTDEEQLTLVREHQRYETRIKLMPAHSRNRFSLVINETNDMFAALESAPNSKHSTHKNNINITNFIAAQTLQTKAFTTTALARSLHVARSRGLTRETHAHVIHVKMHDSTPHRLTMDEQVVAILFIFLAVMLAICIVLCASTCSSRFAKSSAGGGSTYSSQYAALATTTNGIGAQK